MDSEADPRFQAGSVMMLMPAAVLIMVVLAAITVDRAVVFGAQRDLVASAQAIADNGASLGVDVDQLRGHGEVTVDLEAIASAIDQASLGLDPGTTLTWYLQGTDVVVELDQEVPLVFASGVPGANDVEMVHARASAELRLSDP